GRQEEFGPAVESAAGEDPRIGLERERVASDRDLKSPESVGGPRSPLEVLLTHAAAKARRAALGRASLLPGRARHAVEEDRRDPQVLAGSGVVPLMELALRSSEHFLNVGHERKAAAREELHAGPGFLDCLREGGPRVRAAGEGLQ